MTTSDTRDIVATIEQCLRLHDAGCEIVRVTVQGIKEAEACEGIKNGLLQKGLNIPLVADIHFYPPAAMKVVEFVDKVRINPGNFVDKRASFKQIIYDDTSYAAELVRIEEKFSPLVVRCKELKKSLRIGANHGSLSDRIMSRYGDTPEGMVESALEFARVCRAYDFHDIIFSMKASNPLVMMAAYRLLVTRMELLGWDYPLHLGVTEAGEGEDGRVKSAMGMGGLLLEGIGDTIRVSLTEDPWKEIDPCKRLVRLAEKWQSATAVGPSAVPKRIVVTTPPLHRDGSVFLSLDEGDLQRPDFLQMVGCDWVAGQLKRREDSADGCVLRELPKERSSFDVLQKLQQVGIPLFSPHALPSAEALTSTPQAHRPLWLSRMPEEPWQVMPSVVFVDLPHFSLRQALSWLNIHAPGVPLLLAGHYEGQDADILLQVAAECGVVLCDGGAEGLCLQIPSFSLRERRQLSFNVMQAARRRIFKTDFISCPGCGRTLFDLQEVTKNIRARTHHLAGVKIAIMGCIVNGPGEMADADFGYVGSKTGMIDLYVGKQCVEKDIPSAEAQDRLIALIKSYGRWKE